MLLFYLSLLETEEEKSKFERLYIDYGKLMKNIATEMLHSELQAEDAMHEAFIKLARYLDGIDEDNRHKTTAFIVIIIKSVCLDMLRKDKQDKSFSLEEMDNVRCDNNDLFENIELEHIYSAIKSLPDTYRDVIELKAYYHLSDKEISDILCINNAAVRKRLQRAREILRKKLAEQGEEYVSV